MFRTSDAVGVSKIYCTGYTPCPIDEMGRPRKEVKKTALGGEKSVPWEHERNISKLIKRLKKEKFSIIALEQTSKSKDYRKHKVKFPTALIVGNEVRGIPKSILKKVDTCLSIPMKGKKESLNVSVAFGIAVYRLLAP